MKIAILRLIGISILSVILAYCFVSLSRDQWNFHEWNNYMRFGELKHYRVSGLKCFLMLSFAYFFMMILFLPLYLSFNRKN
jgi:uncharacterized membrane protein